MCPSPRQPEDEATDAGQRALEEEEEARLASASLAAGDPTGWFDRLYAAGARGQAASPLEAPPTSSTASSLGQRAGAFRSWPARGCGWLRPGC